MPRLRRIVPDNTIHHVLNRGNRRQVVFHDDDDYDRFFNLLADSLERHPMRILAVCLMPTHFHMTVWPTTAGSLSAYMTCLMNKHVRQHHKKYGTVGHGHIWQGRYKNFMVQNDGHLFNVLRYVEANPLRAGLVSRADDWQWSTLSRRVTPDGRSFLSEWPVARPAEWQSYVNFGIDAEELAQLRNAVRRGCPYGNEWFVEESAEIYGLRPTCTDLGRPRSHGIVTF